MLDRDAGNFADWFRHMLPENPELISDLNNELTKVIRTGFSRIRLKKVSDEVRALTVDQVGGNSDVKYDLRFDEMSDGQRALVVLYGLIHLTRGQGYTLLIDEPENYIALREIQPWLMSLEDACGDTLPQAVITSHHPEMIDYLGPQSGQLLQRGASDVITVRPAQEALDGTADKPGLKLSEVIARGWEQ